LAISYANEITDIVDSNVHEFLFVSDINLEKNQITFLSTLEEIKYKFLIVGDFKWVNE
jgi:hypothetical protein